MKRLGILLSGRGSNLAAIAESIAQGRLRAEIAVVIGNRASAPGLEIARSLNLRAVAMPSQGIDREEYDARLAGELQASHVDLVCLAGYMRLLSGGFIRAFPQRILNIHPSLLPAFPGLDAQRQAFDHGVKIAGCTVHFVDERLDAGPIVRQASIEVQGHDTRETLASRILDQEHRIYSEAIQFVLDGNFEMDGRRVVCKSL